MAMGIVQSDCMWQQRFPGSVPLTAVLKQPVRKGNLPSVCGVMERLLIIVHDG